MTRMIVTLTNGRRVRSKRLDQSRAEAIARVYEVVRQAPAGGFLKVPGRFGGVVIVAAGEICSVRIRGDHR